HDATTTRRGLSSQQRISPDLLALLSKLFASGCRRYLSAATPGRVRPPRNSSDAPPPVEMCVILSVTPALATAAIESPPPITVIPFTAGTALATSIVPLAKASISNTPIGPFQMTVLAPAITDR